MSSIYIEDHIPVVKYEGFNTEKAVSISGAATLSGATTLSGPTSVTGALTYSGAQSGQRLAWETQTGNDTLTAADSGKVINCTKSSGTQTFTLPSAATAGLFYTFRCGHADGEILINPITGQTISIKATDGGANVTTAAGTGIKNTAASNVVGDTMTLVSDGGTGWHMISMNGTWASQ